MNNPSTNSVLRVDQSFNELAAALDYYKDDIKLERLYAEDSQDEALTSKLRQLTRLSGLVAEAQRDWKRALENRRHRVCSPKDQGHSRGRNTILRVAVNGVQVPEGKGSEVFAAALDAIGLTKVAELKKSYAGTPLVSREEATDYKNQKLLKGWYILIHFSNLAKKQVLEEVGLATGTPIKVEIIRAPSDRRG